MPPPSAPLYVPHEASSLPAALWEASPLFARSAVTVSVGGPAVPATPVTGRYSEERLVHYSCGYCGGWWTVGDGDPAAELHCPRCCRLQRFDPAPPVMPTN